VVVEVEAVVVAVVTGAVKVSSSFGMTYSSLFSDGEDEDVEEDADADADGEDEDEADGDMAAAPTV